MTREELKEHCEKQVKGCEMWARSRGEKPCGKVYEEHKLILELLDREQEPKTEGWIPISKRLPKEAVLACDMYGCMIVGIIYEDEKNSAETGYTAEDEGCCLIDVVAWQPLPKPYKGDR